MPAYHAIWQDYERHESPAPINIRFNAVDTAEALKKIFLKKVAGDWPGGAEAYLSAEPATTEADLTEEFLVDHFDNIDIGGWPFLVKLVNLDTNEEVYSIGELGEDDDNDEIWED